MLTSVQVGHEDRICADLMECQGEFFLNLLSIRGLVLARNTNTGEEWCFQIAGLAIQHYTIWSLWVCLPWPCDTLSGDLDIDQCAAGHNWHETGIAAFQQWCFANEGSFENADIAEWKTAFEKDSLWSWKWMLCVKVRGHPFSTQRFKVSYWLLLSLQPIQLAWKRATVAEVASRILRKLLKHAAEIGIACLIPAGGKGWSACGSAQSFWKLESFCKSEWILMNEAHY